MSAGNPLRRTELTIGFALVALTVGGWVLLVREQAGMDPAAMLSPTMGMGALLFLGVWLAMVAAMMFPAVAPMILMFARVAANRRASGRPLAPTSFFVAGYVLVWGAIGIVAFVLGLGVEQLADRVPLLADNAGRIGAVLIVAAGAYQFSPWKDRCMTECRSPLAFLAQHWREGGRGAVAMGVHHGLVCAGCCWALMAIMFPLGMMNIAALGAVTVLIFGERVLPRGRLLQHAAGIVLLVVGIVVLVRPDLLPGAGTPMSATMPMG